MNRISTLVCCAVAVLAGGAGFFSGNHWTEKADEVSDKTSTAPVELNPAWQFTSQPETGPALIAGPNPLVPGLTSQSERDEPDVAWFPEAIGESESGEPRLLSPEQQQMWRNQTGLSTSEADELLSIRRQLASEGSDAAPQAADSGEEIQPLSGISPAPDPIEDESEEPGRLQLPPQKLLRAALPQGPLLPNDFQLVNEERDASSECALLTAARETVQRNCANAQTIGFRRQTIVVLRGPSTSGATDESQLHLVSGTESEAPKATRPSPQQEQWETRLDLQRGRFVETGDPCDLAIHSVGWLRFSTKDGDGLTRCGLLKVDSQNRLAVRTAAGVFPLVPVITLPEKATRIEVSESGEVSAYRASETEPTICGQISLVNFRSPAHLTWSDRGFYESTVDSGEAFVLEPGKTSIHQGFLEQSNVDESADREMLKRIRDLTAAVEP